ncbi:MAG: hypothetical protein HWQ43_23920 [Nostoc sp. JL31]|uniref:hypothetical protein n=1 Tax=Nostoc sp. JL31 TaxID=2815395 RepID=UPI0025E30758|nr:hypothetical protein [Nostoc sp. JL31]MBN3892074.1 hypothetical protein [Nostoc sp. JL31]
MTRLYSRPTQSAFIVYTKNICLWYPTPTWALGWSAMSDDKPYGYAFVMLGKCDI